MTMTNFLAEIALASFEAEINANAEKIRHMEAAIRWERQKQSMWSSLSVMLQSAQLSRKELNSVIAGLKDATPDELLEKIQFVADRLPEVRDPRKQYTERCRVFSDQL